MMNFLNNCSKNDKNGVIGSLELKNLPLPSINDSRWEFVGTVQNLNIYPIKSCGSVSSHHSMRITKYGLQYGEMKDRQFMIADETLQDVDAIKQPRLVMIEPRVENGVLFLNAPGMETLEVQLPTSTNNHEIVVSENIFQCTNSLQIILILYIATV